MPVSELKITPASSVLRGADKFAGQLPKAVADTIDNLRSNLRPLPTGNNRPENSTLAAPVTNKTADTREYIKVSPGFAGDKQNLQSLGFSAPVLKFLTEQGGLITVKRDPANAVTAVYAFSQKGEVLGVLKPDNGKLVDTPLTPELGKEALSHAPLMERGPERDKPITKTPPEEAARSSVKQSQVVKLKYLGELRVGRTRLETLR